MLAHTVLQIMEKAGMGHSNVNLALEYIKDALFELQLRGKFKTKKTPIDLVKDQRYYNKPTDYVQFIRVYAYDSDDEKYYQIPRAVDIAIPDTDENIGTTISGDLNDYIFIMG